MGFCSRSRRPRRCLAGGGVSIDHRGRLWRVRRVPDIRSIFDGTSAGRSIDHIGAFLSCPRHEATRVIAGTGSLIHSPADGAARLAHARLSVAAASRERHRRHRRRVSYTRPLRSLPSNAPAFSHVLTVMDASWMDVVQERSQFLFLQLWSIRDWVINARPFIYLAFTAFAVTDERIRKLCMVAALVGAAGLAVAFIGGLIGPVAILVQGQAWRWVWIGVFVSAALAPFTLLRVWRDEKCGPLCALLMVSGWTLPGVDGMACASLGLIFWLVRAHMSSRSGISFSMGIRCAWRRHRDVDFGEMLGHRLAPDSSIGTCALRLGASTRYFRVEDPGRAARCAGLVGTSESGGRHGCPWSSRLCLPHSRC